jgi:hypothetical protein
MTRPDPSQSMRGATRTELLLGACLLVVTAGLAAVVVPRESCEHARPPERVSLSIEGLDIAPAGSALHALILQIVEQIDESSRPRTSKESVEASLASHLATIRQAIEMYRVQHAESLPTDLAEQLVNKTDKCGSPGTTYGPYLRSGIPDNPFTGSQAVRLVETMPDEPWPHGGWLYCTTTGELRADCVHIGPSGMPAFKL